MTAEPAPEAPYATATREADGSITLTCTTHGPIANVVSGDLPEDLYPVLRAHSAEYHPERL